MDINPYEKRLPDSSFVTFMVLFLGYRAKFQPYLMLCKISYGKITFRIRQVERREPKNNIQNKEN